MSISYLLRLACALVSVSLLALTQGWAVPVSLAQSTGSLGVRVQLENEWVRPDAPLIHTLLELEGREGAGTAELPLNVALVIDRSGSMRGAKIADARSAALKMLDRLRNGDRVSVISYSESAVVNVSSRRLDSRSRRLIRDAIYGIRDGGATNLSDGLVKGLSEVRRYLDPQSANRVILISDGIANRGVTALDALNRIACGAAQEGIVTTTLGLGTDYNEDLMTSVADHGGGNYHYVRDSRELDSVLNRELAQMMATVARELIVEVTLPYGVELEDVPGYVWERKGRTIFVRLGDVYAGQRRAILFRYRLSAGATSLGTLSLRYVEASASGSMIPRLVESRPTIQWTSDPRKVAAGMDANVSARVAELELATSVQRAAELAEQGRVDDARATLQKATVSAQQKSQSLGVAGNGLAASAGEAEALVGEMQSGSGNIKHIIKKSKSSSYKMKKK